MDTIFINSENSKTSDAHKQLLRVKDIINLKGSDKHVALTNYSICYTCKKQKYLYKSKKFKSSGKTWGQDFELPHGSCSVSDIQNYFEYIKRNELRADNPPIQIYVNIIENKITFKIKSGYYLELLTHKTEITWKKKRKLVKMYLN